MKSLSVFGQPQAPTSGVKKVPFPLNIGEPELLEPVGLGLGDVLEVCELPRVEEELGEDEVEDEDEDDVEEDVSVEKFEEREADEGEAAEVEVADSVDDEARSVEVESSGLRNKSLSPSGPTRKSISVMLEDESKTSPSSSVEFESATTSNMTGDAGERPVGSAVEASKFWRTGRAETTIRREARRSDVVTRRMRTDGGFLCARRLLVEASRPR